LKLIGYKLRKERKIWLRMLSAADSQNILFSPFLLTKQL